MRPHVQIGPPARRSLLIGTAAGAVLMAGIAVSGGYVAAPDGERLALVAQPGLLMPAH